MKNEKIILGHNFFGINPIMKKVKKQVISSKIISLK